LPTATGIGVMQKPIDPRRRARGRTDPGTLPGAVPGFTFLLAPVLAPVLAVALFSCSFDYSSGQVEATRTEEIPQVELVNVRTVVERDNRLELNARRVATYRDRRVQEFEELTFREFGPAGDIRVEGTAEAGTMDLDTEDVELLGTVRFYSRTEEARLKSSFLQWDNASRVLVGRPDGTVSIIRDDGSWVEGEGLRLDGRRNKLELTGGLTGEFVSGKDE
jgi:LPS export ABC transporter protein LptC